MTELWLIRHGQTDWNVAGRWQGQSAHAPGLNDLGYSQALAIFEQIKGKRISAIYSSDLLRARQTAELIGQPLGLKVNLEPRLREINLGDWEGMLSVNIAAKYPHELAQRALDPFHTRAPNGESPQDVVERVLAAVNEIAGRHPNESVVIVGHGVSLAVIICHAQGFSMEDVYQHIPDNAQPYHVHWHNKNIFE
jgi:broad specificity phosphatase PhoE